MPARDAYLLEMHARPQKSCLCRLARLAATQARQLFVLDPPRSEAD